MVVTLLQLLWECPRCGCATVNARCWWCGQPKSGMALAFEGDREEAAFELWGGEGP